MGLWEELGYIPYNHDVNVDTLLQEDGSFTQSDYEIANTLDKFFTSVFARNRNTNLHDRSNGYILWNIDLIH